jgi:CheY-like chemotaxis protein
MAHKLLLADDSVTIQKVVELTFSEEDFTIVATGDGTTAYERIKSDPPDIILSDVNMPGMNGYDLCAKVKQDAGLSGIPFLFLRGTFESFDEARASAVGADGFIVKPFESQELISRVKELVLSSKSASAAAAPTPVEPPAPSVAESVSFPAQIPEFVQPANVEAPPEPVFFEAEPPAAAFPEPPAAPSFGEPPPALPSFPSVEPVPPAAAPVVDEDLWSEVPASQVAPAAMGEITRPGEPAFDFEQAVGGAIDEAPVPQVSEPEALPSLESFEMPAALLAPPDGSAYEPEFPTAYQALPEAAAVVTPPVAPAAAAIDADVLARMVAASLEETLARILPGIVREVVQQATTEVLWEVLPETAERLITREINRLTGASPEA